MTPQEKAREREAKVAQLARDCFVAAMGSGRPLTAMDAFDMSTIFERYAESRWEALK